jgi:sugar-specific transcriptional regulator TrmB
MDFLDRMDQLSEKFYKDADVNELIEKIKAKFKEKFDETFSDEYVNTEEFEEGCEEVYAGLRECDPDDVTILDVLWFDGQ